MHFSLHYTKTASHVHVRMYSGEHGNLTHPYNGNLTFNEKEWEAFLRCFQDRGTDTITVIPDAV